MLLTACGGSPETSIPTTPTTELAAPRTASFGQEAPSGCGEDYQEENWENCQEWLNGWVEAVEADYEDAVNNSQAPDTLTICPECKDAAVAQAIALDEAFQAVFAQVAACSFRHSPTAPSGVDLQACKDATEALSGKSTALRNADSTLVLCRAIHAPCVAGDLAFRPASPWYNQRPEGTLG